MKNQNIKKKNLIITTLLLVILGFPSIKPFTNPFDKSQINEVSNNFNLRVSTLINLTGSPILIDNLDSLNDWGVAELQAWCSGSGQFNDPYIIRNILIDGLFLTPCIEISNSIDWFIIENCTLFNGKYESIKLTNVTNGVIVNNTLTKNQYGLKTLESHNNTIIENEMVNCGNGIKMDKSENNTIIKNNIISNDKDGIYLDECHYNSFTNNNISYSQETGVLLNEGSYNEFINNSFNNNEENGIQFYSPCNYNNVTGNTANSNYQSGIEISGCVNNTLYNNTVCFNNKYGIEIWGSQNHTISKNILKDNHYEGMFIRTSTDFLFNNNYLEANHESGFYLSESEDLIFRNNVMIGQEEMTLYGSLSQLASFDIDLSNKINGRSVYYYVNLTQLDSSNFTDSGHSILVNCSDSIITNSSGVALYYSNNITVQSNNKISDLYTGIYIENSDYNNISQNIIKDCFKGIGVSYGNYNDIFNNTLINHSEYAIHFSTSSNTNVSNNQMYECGIGIEPEMVTLEDMMSHNFDTNNYVNDGKLYYYESKNYLDEINFTDAGQIILANCTGAKISNIDASVSLYYSSDNDITNINVSHYFNYGIMLYKSHRNNITHSFIHGNSMGLLIRRSNSNNISKNIVNNNLGTGSWEYRHMVDPGDGIFLSVSHNNIVSYNHIENSTYYGLDISGSDNNAVIGNNISCNDYGGIYLENGDNNDINESRIFQNNGYGMFLRGSNSNTIFENFILGNNNPGILLEASDNNEFISNNLCYNEYGAYLNKYSNGNIFYLNNFTGNYNANAYQAAANNWNSTTVGNYWDNYTGKDINDDNIGDSAFDFGTGTDNLPIFWDGPVISLNSPSPSENSESAPSFEIAVIEGVEHTTWYTLDNGITNITSSGLTSTIDETAWSSATDGSIQLIFYVNDSKGYMDQVSVDITKITDIPLINIISPTLNQEFGNQPPDFTITITDSSSIVSMWYTLDGGINNDSFTGLTDSIATIPWGAAPEGELTLSFYAEDEIGNVGFLSRIIIKNLSVIPSEPPPDIPDETPLGIPGFKTFILVGVIAILTLVITKRKKYKIK